MGSCVRETGIAHIADHRIQPVILGFLTPGDSIQIYVGKTQPFKTDHRMNEEGILDALVFLSGPKNKIQLLNEHQEQHAVYVAAQEDFEVIPGEEYFLEVIIPDYETVVARTRIPDNMANWTSLQLVSNNQGRHDLTGTWQSVNSTDDGYGLPGYGVVIFKDKDPITFLQGNIGIRNVSDDYFIHREVYIGYNTHIALITKDSHLDEFSKMSELTLQLTWPQKDIGFFDLLAGFKGTIPQATNIQNGLGVFGSYLMDVQPLPKQ